MKKNVLKNSQNSKIVKKNYIYIIYIINWEPTYQIGESWVANAKPQDVHVIYCLCIVELIIGILNVFASLKQIFRQNRISAEEEKMSKTNIEKISNYMIHIFQIYAPIFGICAIKLDCLELLQVNFLFKKSR